MPRDHQPVVRIDREITADVMHSAYDFIVCGGGTAGSVVARRLAEDPEASVLLLEAGGSDRVPMVMDSTQWMWNIGTERDWQFQAAPSPSLNGRTPPLPMGRVLGGGSSINGSVWARGHRTDFDNWADETGDPGWGYEAVLDIYRRVEDWDGPADPRRGTGGLLHVTQPVDPIPLAPALVAATDAVGIPAVEDINGDPMEGDGGCGLPNLLVRDGNERVSMAATYLHPFMGRPNLSIVLAAEVTRLIITDGRATGVEFIRRGRRHTVKASREVIVSLGAINTPKVLMLSGIGDEYELKRHDIPVAQHLLGVGRNFQDHILLAGCIWEYQVPEPPRNNAAEFVLFAKSDPSLPSPDLMPVLEETPFASEVTVTQFDVPTGPASAWTLAPGLARPESRGQVRLASGDPGDKPIIEANFLSARADVDALIRCVELCREIGNAPELRPFRKREVMPGELRGSELETFVRNAAGTYFHETCTAKMGRDAESVVDGSLKVYGIEGLRIADGSVMPRISTGNTMAPCVIIGERAAAMIAADHGLSPEPAAAADVSR
jgi:choline dehydrogenase-like flavoprotein